MSHALARLRRTPFASALLIAALGASALLSACGGGGDDGPKANPSSSGNSAAYAGKWLGDCIVEGTNSYRTQLVFTATSGTTLQVATTYYDYTGTVCGGTARLSSGTGQVSIVGTKTASGDVVDKVNITMGGSTMEKDILYSDGRKMVTGDSSADSAGYPNALDNSFAFHLQ